jgi:hypothetical protein
MIQSICAGDGFAERKKCECRWAVDWFLMDGYFPIGTATTKRDTNAWVSEREDASRAI